MKPSHPQVHPDSRARMEMFRRFVVRAESSSDIGGKTRATGDGSPPAIVERVARVPKGASATQ
jgi:hypothetical protein